MAKGRAKQRDEEEEYPLDPLGNRALEHWKEHRPKMYRNLERRGLLQKAAYEAQERTKREFGRLVEDGVDPADAEVLVRELYVLLPTEEDVPDLSLRQDPWRSLNTTADRLP